MTLLSGHAARPAARPIALAAALVLAATGAAAQSLRQPEPGPTPGEARFHATLEAARLHALLDAEWQVRMQESPEYATSLGDHRGDDRLTDASPEAVARRDAHARETLKALKRLDRDALAGEDRLSYDIALQDAQLAVDFQKYPALHTRVLSGQNGPQFDLPDTMRDMPVRNELDARHALARLRAMPAYIAQVMAWAREGKRLGWVPFKASLAKVPEQVDALTALPFADNPLVAPFARLPPDLPADTRQALQDEAAATLRDRVLPAFADLRKLVVDELLPASPDNGAMSGYPDGAAIYKLQMRAQTTLDLDAQQVHALGLSEVARLHARIAEVMRALKFDGSDADFVAFMNHDARFFFTKADDLLAAYRDIAKRVDAQLPGLFLVLPRTPYGVRAIPAFEGSNVAEYYTEGAVDGSTPGWFNANVVALAQRPRWQMAALFLHEGVPGHHLQISRAHELIQLPLFRRVLQPNAYIGGWALYSEGLGEALGLYADPESRYGQLKLEVFRAARLVVDTGIHALGWTRAQAIAYLVDEAGLAPEDVTVEVDRDTVWPAQALGDKLGQLKILALREKARAALGDRFDLRAFHQEVLDHGALPLPVLDQVITDWIARVQAGRGTPPPALISSTALP